MSAKPLSVLCDADHHKLIVLPWSDTCCRCWALQGSSQTEFQNIVCLPGRRYCPTWPPAFAAGAKSRGNCCHSGSQQHKLCILSLIMLIVAIQLHQLPISASSQDPLPAVLSKDNSDGTLVARHFRALPHHKFDQRATPHQQTTILCTAQNLQQQFIHSLIRYTSSFKVRCSSSTAALAAC
jgi:hypothetical protein